MNPIIKHRLLEIDAFEAFRVRLVQNAFDTLRKEFPSVVEACNDANQGCGFNVVPSTNSPCPKIRIHREIMGSRHA
jgi:hypothetical protein